MAVHTRKYFGLSDKYKGVSLIANNKGESKWMAQKTINGIHWRKEFNTERGAAKAYDIKMIELGKEPVNILKRK